MEKMGFDISSSAFELFKLTQGKWSCDNGFDKEAFWRNYFGRELTDEEIDCLDGRGGINSIKGRARVVLDALNDFEETYNLTLSSEVRALLSKCVSLCGEVDVECAIISIIETEGGIDPDDQGGYDKLNDCEKALVKEHPLCAWKIRSNRKMAFEMEMSIFGFLGRNDCGDAFRHAFFNALNAQSCGAALAKEFGDAHECNTPDTELSEKMMDLHNNAVGVSVAEANPGATAEELADLICTELLEGNLEVLSDPENPLSDLIDSDAMNCSCQ